jgi:hypothetical protein
MARTAAATTACRGRSHVRAGRSSQELCRPIHWPPDRPSNAPETPSSKKPRPTSRLSASNLELRSGHSNSRARTTAARTQFTSWGSRARSCRAILLSDRLTSVPIRTAADHGVGLPNRGGDRSRTVDHGWNRQPKSMRVPHNRECGRSPSPPQARIVARRWRCWPRSGQGWRRRTRSAPSRYTAMHPRRVSGSGVAPMRSTACRTARQAKACS